MTIYPIIFKTCTRCAYHHMPAGLLIKYGTSYLLCAHGARRDAVTGAPAAIDSDEKMQTCYEARAKNGKCGQAGRLFKIELESSDFNRLFNPADLSVDGHGLDESGQQNGVIGGVTVAQDTIDLNDGSAQVPPDVFSSHSGSGIDH